MLVLLCVVKWRLLVNVDAFVCRVASAKHHLKDLKVTRDAHQVHGILLLSILGFDIGVIFDEQVHHLAIAGEDSIVERTRARLWLLVVNIDCHVPSEIQVDESCHCVVIFLLSRFHERLTLFEVSLPPWPPDMLVLVLELCRART